MIVGLDNLCEYVCKTYGIMEMVNQLKEMVEDELSTTITQFINTKSLTTNDITDTSDKFVVGVPINDYSDIIQYMDTHNGVANVYIKTTSYTKEPVTTTDSSGNRFVNTITTPQSDDIFMGDIIRNNNGTWSVRVSDKLPAKYVDIDLYSKCWNNCKSPNLVRDFINDVYNRINQLGQYSTQKDESTPPDNYIAFNKILFTPSKIIEYMKNNSLYNYNEADNMSDKEQIRIFLEDITNSDEDSSKLLNIDLDEDTGKFLFGLGTGYVLSKSVANLLKKLGADVKYNPAVDKYLDINLSALNNNK